MKAMNELQVISENAIVVQSNELIEANYKLSTAEQRLILALASQIDTRKSDFEIVRVTAKSLSEACGFNSKGGYRQLQQTAKKLLNRSLIIKNRNNDDWDGTHWVQYCKYRSQKKDDIDGSYIEVEFDKRLCPHLLQLSNKFLKANLNQLVSFSHIYSTRFYMIFRNLVNNLPKCTKKYTFKEIINLLELPKSYEKTVDLKNKVIKVSVNEINAKSDIEVEYEYYRGGGRAHIGVLFTFWRKQTKQIETGEKENPITDELAEQVPPLTSSVVKEIAPPSSEDEDIEDMFERIKKADVENYFALPEELLEDLPEWTEEPEPKKEKEPAPAPAVAVAEVAEEPFNNWSDEQQADFDALIKCGVWAKTAHKIVETYDHARIERNRNGCVLSNPKGNIRDLGAVVVSAIDSDIYQWLEEAGRKAREREEKKKKEEWEAQKRAEKEKEEQKRKEHEKLEELAKIRASKTKKELIEVFECVSKRYIENKRILTPEMLEELEQNGIPEVHFRFYQGQIGRSRIKYIQ